MRVLSSIILTACLAFTSCQPASETKPEIKSEGVTAASILAQPTDSWLTHGGGYDEKRFSPLSSVSTETVNQLGLEWSYDLGTSRGIEATPIVHDGMMYVTSTWNILHAMDARTGEKLWEFDPAIWGDKVYTATIDGRLIALDAKTGKVIWDKQTIDKSKPYTITGAPRIVKGKVIIGNGGAELGVRGYFSAYDAETGEMDWRSETGEMDWRFYTVPGNPADGFENDTMKMAAETWTGEWWAAGGGGTSWDSMAYDPELDLLYVWQWLAVEPINSES